MTIAHCKNCPEPIPASEVKMNIWSQHLSCKKHILEGNPECKDCVSKLQEFARENNIHLVGF